MDLLAYSVAKIVVIVYLCQRGQTRYVGIARGSMWFWARFKTNNIAASLRNIESGLKNKVYSPSSLHWRATWLKSQKV